MRRQEYLRPLLAERPDQVGRDRLEILTALIARAVLRSGLPARHHHDPAWSPGLPVGMRGRPLRAQPRTGGSDLCSVHQRQWAAESERGVGKAAFVTAAQALDRRVGAQEVICQICPGRPAAHNDLRLCQRHLSRWTVRKSGEGEGEAFAAGQRGAALPRLRALRRGRLPEPG